MEEIEKWRRRIDELDAEIARLLHQRTKCALEIGRYKARHQLSVFDPQREEEVIANVLGVEGNSLDKPALRRVFERIIDETRRSEREHRKEHEAEVAAGQSYDHSNEA